MEWVNIFADNSDKRLIPKVYKVQDQKINPIKKLAKDLSRHNS